MNDHELDQLLRRAQPESATRVPLVAPMLTRPGRNSWRKSCRHPKSHIRMGMWLRRK